jgi:hypothetical protein
METKNRLGIQTQKLDTLLEKLKSKDRTLLIKLLLIYKILMVASRCLMNSQVRKTIKTISQLKMSLEQVHMRLESIDIGDALTALKQALEHFQK